MLFTLIDYLTKRVWFICGCLLADDIEDDVIVVAISILSSKVIPRTDEVKPAGGNSELMKIGNII